jgi:hypothetical protein
MWCRRLTVSMLLMCGVPSVGAAAPRESTRAVSIRIHDYSQFEDEQLLQAQRQVSETYARIGVRLDWHTVVRPAEVLAGKGEWPRDSTPAVTVVVLAAEMADRLSIPPDVAGYAPITRERGGRIAFVVGPRARDIAGEGHVDTSKVLAGVIAHELAHLLMPGRSHSEEGVMRPHYTPTEFRRVHSERFTPDEAASIRHMVQSMGGGPSRVAD